MAVSRRVPMGGRSPRVRGRLMRRCVGSAGRRSIPAGAGETRSKSSKPNWRQVDPRGCGGDRTAAIRVYFRVGRSPRVRGRPVDRQGCCFDRRSIPAGAGETGMVRALGLPRRVDPRGCGGDDRRPYRRRGGLGRSPRVRGRHTPTSGIRGIVGSIPAGAGETHERKNPQHDFWVDPRGCGGDSRRRLTPVAGTGRSPRVRGRRRQAERPGGDARSIPAGAGETSRRWANQQATRVDPRGCGGDRRHESKREFRAGRSPRVRGRQQAALQQVRHTGSIPAGAGET